jgi:uncharacterized protein (UPF0276 family)
MVAGGPRLAWLEAIRTKHPVSLHGVALSLAADAEPDLPHLERLAALVRRIEPALVSEHLAWSAWRGAYHPDLLPFPRTNESLSRIVASIARTQDILGQRIAIENPSHYMHIDGHTWDEVDFLQEMARRAGCGLLLDVNNVYVSACNLGYSALDYLDRFPGELVMEIHVAGHALDAKLGMALLIDSHDASVASDVWTLYKSLIDRIGSRPTLIERDDNLAEFDALLAERNIAESFMRTSLAKIAA